METRTVATVPHPNQARRNKIGGVLILVVIALGISWCTWHGSQGGAPPQTLQNLDAAGGHSHPLGEYKNVWGDAMARCTESSDQLQALIENVLPTLRATYRQTSTALRCCPTSASESIRRGGRSTARPISLATRERTSRRKARRNGPVLPRSRRAVDAGTGLILAGLSAGVGALLAQVMGGAVQVTNCARSHAEGIPTRETRPEAGDPYGLRARVRGLP